MTPHDPRSISGRARTGGGVDPQDGLFDREIEDGDLIAALERREEKRLDRVSANAAFKIEADNVKDLLLNFPIEVGETVRVGRFRLTKSHRDGNSVAFETAPRDQLNIGVIADDG